MPTTISSQDYTVQLAYFKLPTIFVQLQSSIVLENKSWRIGREVCSLPNMSVCEGGVRGPEEADTPASNSGDWSWGPPLLIFSQCVCAPSPRHV